MDTPIDDYRIRLARADEAARLRAIEDEAGTMFAGLGLIDETRDPSFPLDIARRLIDLGQVWVACCEDDVPVGMVIASVRDGAAYIEELDVVPAHSRRGLGSRLIARVCDWAQAQGLATVTLSTFRDVPWNAPFYRKRGFRDLSPAEWTQDMYAIREREEQHGLRVEARVFMRRVMLIVAIALCASASGRAASAPTPEAARPRYKAVAFDAFVLFNPDSILSTVERIFPGKGRDVASLWRNRQFEYAWLRSMTNQYVDFSAVTDDALVYAVHALRLEMTASQKGELLQAYLQLTPWPDTADALKRLRESGVRIVTLTNFSPMMLRANAEHAGLLGSIDLVLSTDANHTYKPDPRAYQLGIDQLHLAKQDIVFVAFGGWDAAGAKSFGYPTIWVNRFNQPLEELGGRPDRIVSDLNGLLDIVLQ